MKKILLPIFTVLILASSCKKEEPPSLFSMDYEVDFTIPTGLNPSDGIHGVKIRDIPSNIQSYLIANNMELEDIVEIDQAFAKVTADFSGVRYNFIRVATVRIVDSEDDSIYNPIFERFEIPDNTGPVLDMIPTLINPTEFLKKETFDIWFEMELRDFSPSLLDSRLTLQFRVLDK